MHLICKIRCNENISIYFDQIDQHTAAKVLEHQKKNSSMGQHLVEYCGTAINIERNILDLCSGNEKSQKKQATSKS